MDEGEEREQERFDRRMAREQAERERVAALEKDAARYRWLRDMQHDESEDQFVMVNGYGDLKDESLDLAIDEKMAGRQETEVAAPTIASLVSGDDLRHATPEFPAIPFDGYPVVCPYCTSDNQAIRSTYYDQNCEGCVKRMGQ